MHFYLLQAVHEVTSSLLSPGNPRSDLFPDPSQLDISVTCDGPSVKLDVQFPAGSCCAGKLPGRVSIDLTLAVGMTGWPGRADFPGRVPLSSVDALVVHRAASKVGGRQRHQRRPDGTDRRGMMRRGKWWRAADTGWQGVRQAAASAQAAVVKIPRSVAALAVGAAVLWATTGCPRPVPVGGWAAGSRGPSVYGVTHHVSWPAAATGHRVRNVTAPRAAAAALTRC